MPGTLGKPVDQTPDPQPAPEAAATASHRRLCVGMATFDDFDGVYFTIQSMRMLHAEVLGELSFLILDNDPAGAAAAALRRLAQAIPDVAYLPFGGYRSTAVRDLLFREADADIVLCVDSHVLVRAGGLRALLDYFDAHPDSRDIVQGPLLADRLDDVGVGTHFAPTWGSGMYGQWATDERVRDPTGRPFEIAMQGLGLFACRRASWPGINPRFRGFGGEEGYLHEKFRQNGGRAISLPALAWCHRFQRPAGIPFGPSWQQRIRNYHIGWAEIGWATTEIDGHFRDHLAADEAAEALARTRREIDSPFMFFDAIFTVTADVETDESPALDQSFEVMDIAWRVEPMPGSAGVDRSRAATAAFRSAVATAQRRGYRNVLILEGGVAFSDNTTAVLADAVEVVDRRAWDLLCLGRVDARGSSPRLRDEPALDAVDRVETACAVGVNASAYDRLLADLPPEDARDAIEAFAARHASLEQYLSAAIADGAFTALATPTPVASRSSQSQAPNQSAAAERSLDVAARAGRRAAAGPYVELVLSGFGVCISVIDTTSLAIADRVAALVPPELIGGAADAVELEFVVSAGRDGSVTVDGHKRCTVSSASEAVAWLRREIDDAMAFRATSAVFVHAGVVGWRGRALLIPGRSGTGKSSLVTALVAAGADYYSDDYAPIDEDGLVEPYARLPSLRGGQSATRRIEPAIRARARPGLPVALVVSTSFRSGSDWQPRVLRGTHAALAVLDNVIMAREQPRSAMRTAARISSQAVVLSGPRPEATEIAGPILAYLDGLIDLGGRRAAVIADAARGMPVAASGASVPTVRAGAVVSDVVQRMRVDAWTAEIVAAFGDAGVRPILLKGPATSAWLYPTDPYRRTYFDADLLVSPADRAVARRVLTARGFEPTPHARLDADLGHALTFVRETDGALVDLHHGLHGMSEVPPERVWAAASSDTRTITVAGVPVTILGPTMQLLHAALHLGALDGPADRAWIDLSRALDLSSAEEWEAAVELAETLGVAHELAARLSRRVDAAPLVERLGTQPAAARYHLGAAVDAGRAPMAVLTIDRLLSKRGLAAKAHYVREKLAVPREELAPVGKLMLGRTGSMRLARAAHAAAVVAQFPGALGAWRHWRRGDGRSGAAAGVSASTANPFGFFDGIFCLNLDSEPKRWQCAARRHQQLGIADRVERFPAVATPERPHRGNALSFRRIVAESHARDFERVLILEDDAVFIDDTIELMSTATAEIAELEWDLFFLGAFSGYQAFPFVDGSSVIQECGPVTTTHAVCIHRRAFAKVLADIPSSGEPFERWLDDHLAFDQYLARRIADGTFRALIPSPRVATQPPLLIYDDADHALADRYVI